MPSALVYLHAYVPHHNAGAELTVHDLNKALVAAGWDITVLLSRETNQREGAVDPTVEYTIDGVRVIPFLHKSQPFELFAEHDIIISHLDASERAAYLCESMGIPLVQIIHNTLWQTEGYLSLGVDLAVYNTQWVADHHDDARFGPLTAIASTGEVRLQTRHCSEWSSVVVHPPIDADLYRHASDPFGRQYVTLINLWAGDKDGLTGKGPGILYALAEAMPDVSFLGVVGGYGKQDIRTAENVTIMDHTTAMVEDVYSQTRVLLMPSKYES